MNLIIFLILVIIVGSFILPFIFFGAWYAPSTKKAIEKMIKLSNLTQDDTVLDIGSGDGKIVIACSNIAKASWGFEINPLLVLISKLRIKSKSLQKQAFVKRTDFWKEDMSQFDVVIVFGVTYVMPRLEEKLKRELKPGARVVSNYFAFPTWQPQSQDGSLYLYIKG